MCKVNDVWCGVLELYPHARFLYWYNILERLEFMDADTGAIYCAGLGIRDDGRLGVVIL